MNKRMLALMRGKEKEEKPKPKPKRKESKPKRTVSGRLASESNQPNTQNIPVPTQVSKEGKEDSGGDRATEDSDHRSDSGRLPHSQGSSRSRLPTGEHPRGRVEAGADPPKGTEEVTQPSSQEPPHVLEEQDEGGAAEREPSRTSEYLTLRAYGDELNAKKAARSYLWVISHCGWCLSDDPLILGEVGKRGGAPKFCSEECAKGQLQYRVVVLGAKTNGSKEEKEEEESDD